MTAITQYDLYTGVHRVRRDWRNAEGRCLEVKPEAEALEGRRSLVMASWQMDADDPYPGEWAMTFERRYCGDFDAGLGWVASGDFESLEYVGPYGCAVPT